MLGYYPLNYLIMCYYYPPDKEHYKNLFDSVKIMQCEINKAKDNTFTLLAKHAYLYVSEIGLSSIFQFVKKQIWTSFCHFSMFICVSQKEAFCHFSMIIETGFLSTSLILHDSIPDQKEFQTQIPFQVKKNKTGYNLYQRLCKVTWF